MNPCWAFNWAFNLRIWTHTLKMSQQQNPSEPPAVLSKSVGNSSNWWIFRRRPEVPAFLQWNWRGPGDPGDPGDLAVGEMLCDLQWLGEGCSTGQTVSNRWVFGPSTVTQSIGNGLLGKPCMYMHHLSYLSSSFIYRVKLIFNMATNTRQYQPWLSYNHIPTGMSDSRAPSVSSKNASDCGDAAAVAEVQALCGCSLGSQGRGNVGH